MSDMFCGGDVYDIVRDSSDAFKNSRNNFYYASYNGLRSFTKTYINSRHYGRQLQDLIDIYNFIGESFEDENF